jgi:hypothetical protein
MYESSKVRRVPEMIGRQRLWRIAGARVMLGLDGSGAHSCTSSFNIGDRYAHMQRGYCAK